MVFLTFVIGVLNLCLGYALAVHLSFGPPNLRDAWYALSAAPPQHDGPQVERERPVLDAWKLLLAAEASEMGTLRDRLREREEEPDHEMIRQCAAELKEICESCLQEQNQAADRFAARFSDQGQLGEAEAGIEEAIYEQLAQLETTINNLKRVDLESDLPAAGERLTEEIERMLGAGRGLWHELVPAGSTS